MRNVCRPVGSLWSPPGAGTRYSKRHTHP